MPKGAIKHDEPLPRLQAESYAPGIWERGKTLLTPTTRKWTKEEWDRNEREERRSIFQHFKMSDQGRSRNRVAIVEDYHPDFERNANLIAAAPELYEQLKAAIEIIRIWHGGDAWDIYLNHSPEMKRIRAALEKAEKGA